MVHVKWNAMQQPQRDRSRHRQADISAYLILIGRVGDASRSGLTASEGVRCHSRRVAALSFSSRTLLIDFSAR